MSHRLVIVERQFEGNVVQQREDGYWNATQMCKANGKEWSNYFQNKGTGAFLDELSSVLGIPRTELVQVQQGGTPGEQGTWVHDQVAIHLAQWCSPRFAVLVTSWVKELLTKGHVSIKPVSSGSVDLDDLLARAKMHVQTIEALREQQAQINRFDERLSRIETERDTAHQEMMTLPPPQVETPDKSVRGCLNECVRSYCKATDEKYSEAWAKIYREVNYRCHVDLKARARNSGKQALDIAEELGMMSSLYAIAIDVFAPKKD